MKTGEIIRSLLSLIFAVVGFFKIFIFGLAHINPHGSMSSDPMSFYLFLWPLAAVLLSASVIYFATKRGAAKKGWLITSLPIVISIVAVFFGVIICGNQGLSF